MASTDFGFWLLIICSCSNGFVFNHWDRYCTYSKWSKCDSTDFLNAIQTRLPTPNNTGNCFPQIRRCTTGTILANAFVDNFLQPSLVPKLRKGYGRSIPHISQENCVEIRNPRTNELLMGNCNTQQQRLSARRSKRFAQKIPSSRNRDLLFVMDKSGSVGPENFDKSKRISAAIVKLLCGEIRVHKNRTRVSVMSFSSVNDLHTPLNGYFNYVEDLIESILNIRYDVNTAGSTCLKNALRFAANDALSGDRGGRREQADVEQDVVLISDGCPNCVNDSSTALRKTSHYLINKNINVYVIGVGLSDVCKDNLKILAQGGKCFHYFYVDEDDDLDSFIDSVENPPHNQCMGSWVDPSKRICAK